MDKFILIAESYNTSFQRQVNAALNKGYKLMAPPTFSVGKEHIAYLILEDKSYVEA